MGICSMIFYFLVAAHIPWFVAAPFQLIPLSLMAFFPVPRLCVSSLLLLRALVIGFRAHSDAVSPHFMLTTSAKILFLNKVTLTAGS